MGVSLVDGVNNLHVGYVICVGWAGFLGLLIIAGFFGLVLFWALIWLWRVIWLASVDLRLLCLGLSVDLVLVLIYLACGFGFCGLCCGWRSRFPWLVV